MDKKCPVGTLIRKIKLSIKLIQKCGQKMPRLGHVTCIKFNTNFLKSYEVVIYIDISFIYDICVGIIIIVEIETKCEDELYKGSLVSAHLRIPIYV